MGGRYDRHFAFGTQAFEQRNDFLTGGQIEVAGRLIGKENIIGSVIFSKAVIT